MSKLDAKRIVKKYAKRLERENYTFSDIYLFGSWVKDEANKWSDIDVAVVSNKLRKNWDDNTFKLWKIRRDVDTRIEPHGFTVEDFKNDDDPMVCEIKKTGVRIA